MNKPLAFRALAIFLSITIMLPNSVFALRPRNAGLEEETQVTFDMKRNLLEGEANSVTALQFEGSQSGLEEKKLVNVNFLTDREIQRFLEQLAESGSLKLPLEVRRQLADAISRLRPYRDSEDFVLRLKGRISNVSLDQLKSIASLFRFGMSRRKFLTLAGLGVGLGVIGGAGISYLTLRPNRVVPKRTEPVVKIQLKGGAWMYTTLSTADGSRQAFDAMRGDIVKLPSRPIGKLNEADMKSLPEILKRKQYTIQVKGQDNNHPVRLVVESPFVPWKYISTSAETADNHLRLFQTAEELERRRKNSGSKNEPIVILDWGAGTGYTLMQYAQRLKQNGFENVIYIAYGDEYYREWEEAPPGIIYIFDIAHDLDLILREVFKDKNLPEGRGVDFIYSHYGLFHYMFFWETSDLTLGEEYPYHFRQLREILSPDGVLATYPRRNIEYKPAPGSSAKTIDMMVRVERGIKKLGWKIGEDPDTLILTKPASSKSGLEEAADGKGLPEESRTALLNFVANQQSTLDLITSGRSEVVNLAEYFPDAKLQELAQRAGYRQGLVQILPLTGMPSDFVGNAIPVFVQDKENWREKVEASLHRAVALRSIRFVYDPKEAYLIIGEEKAVPLKSGQVFIGVNNETILQLTHPENPRFEAVLQDLQQRGLLEPGSIVILYRTPKDSVLIFA